MADDADETYKLVLIGDAGVGKSCLLLRYTDNTFEDGGYTTLNVDYKTRIVEYKNKKLKLQLWDSAGQERFNTVTSSFYRGSHGIIVAYDITDENTFGSVKKWLQEIDRYACESVSKLVLGNKLDLVDDRKVKTEDAKELADGLGIPFMEVSAKDSTNVDEAFFTLAKDIYDRTVGANQPAQASSSGSGIVISQESAGKKPTKRKCNV